jgi:ADP-ribose pyrophosphatase YjhB (NUDIX family)
MADETAPQPGPDVAPPDLTFGVPVPDYSELPSVRQRQAEESGDSLAERFRLNQVNSFYRGTIGGAGRLAVMADTLAKPEDKLTEQDKVFRKQFSDEYPQIVADLDRYDKMRPWGTTLEGATALGGTLFGGVGSPESWLGAPARGTTWLIRTAKAAIQQAAISGASDPVVQWLNMHAGVQDDFDWQRWGMSLATGAILGSGMHAGGELLTALQLKRIKAQLAGQDPGEIAEMEFMRGLVGEWGDSAKAFLKTQATDKWSPHAIEGFSPQYAIEAAQDLGWAPPAPMTSLLSDEVKQQISHIQQQIAGGHITTAQGEQQILDLLTGNQTDHPAGAAAPPPGAPPAAPYAHLPADVQNQIAAIEQQVAAGALSRGEGQQQINELATTPRPKQQGDPTKGSAAPPTPYAHLPADVQSQIAAIDRQIQQNMQYIADARQHVRDGFLTPAEGRKKIAALIAQNRDGQQQIDALASGGAAPADDALRWGKEYVRASGHDWNAMADAEAIAQAKADARTAGADWDTMTSQSQGTWIASAKQKAAAPPAVTPAPTGAPAAGTSPGASSPPPKLGGKQPTLVEFAAQKGIALPDDLTVFDHPEAWKLALEYHDTYGTMKGSNVHVANQHLGTYLSYGLTKEKKPAPAAPAAPAAATPAPAPTAAPAIADASGWTKTGGQKGSNPGGTYKDGNGVDWYVKKPKTEEHARNEILANRLYALAGVDVPDLKFVMLNGKLSVASRMLPPGYKKLGEVTTNAQWDGALENLRKHFAVDAWLANWDVIGATHDNVIVDHLHNAVRIDQGGALRFRAQGAPKAFGPQVLEFDTMRDPAKSKEAGPVFKPMTDQELIDSINRVLVIPEQDIRDAVKQMGPVDAAESEKLADTLIARQDHLRKIREDLKAQIAAKMTSGPAPAATSTPPAASTGATSSHAVTWGKSGGAAPIGPTNPGSPLAAIAHDAAGNSVPAGPHIPTGGPPLKSAKAPKDWNKAAGINKDLAKTEGPINVPAGSAKKPASGVIIREPDGRVWIVAPANQFGGYEHTFPKGKAEPGLSLQANALKEAFEETGLRVKITGLVGDFQGDTSITRYYLAERTGGHPKDAHWESEAVKLVPGEHLLDYLNKPRDHEVLAKLMWGKTLWPGKYGALDPSGKIKPTGALPATKSASVTPAQSPGMTTAPGAPTAPTSAVESKAKEYLKLNLGNVFTGAQVDAMTAAEAIDHATNFGWHAPGSAKTATGIPTAPGTHPTLPMDQVSRYARAAAMGFDTTQIWYHGSTKKFDVFDNTKHKSEPAVFLSPEKDKHVAQAFAHGGPVYPLFFRGKKVLTVDPKAGQSSQPYSHAIFKKKIKEAREQGYDAVLFTKTQDVGGVGDQLAVLHPNLLRSIHAAFDPSEVMSPKLAALKPKAKAKPELQAMMGAGGEEPKAPTPEEFDQAYEGLMNEARDATVDAQGRGEGSGGETPPDLLAIAQRKTGGTLSGEQQRPAAGVPGTGTAVTHAAGTAVGPPGRPAAGGAPGPSPQQAAATLSLQQQVLNFAKALGMTLHEGRVQIKGALGQFNTKSGVTRVKEIPDLVVVAHEAGHFIEAKVGQDLTNLINSHAYELGPLDYDYPNSARPFEGFAELIRFMIGNPPAYAQHQAPNFYIAFRNMMDSRAPDMLKALDDANAAFQAYLGAPSHQVVGAAVRFGDEEGNAFTRLQAKILANGLPNVVGTWMRNIYTAVLDDKAPVARAVRELAQAIREQDPNHALVNLKAAENPEILLRLAARSQQAAVLDMMEGVRPYRSITPEGPSLSGAISKAVGEPAFGGFGKWDRPKMQEFSRYLVARRAEVLWRRFEAGGLPNPPAAFSKADALQAIADFEAGNPTFREAGDMVHGYTRELLRKQYEGGLIDADLYEKLRREEFYVPFMRDMRDKPLTGEPSAGSAGPGAFEGPGMSKTIKAIKGSSRDILDPLESIMMQTFLVNRTLRHNDVIRSFVDLARQAGIEGGKYVEALPAHEAHRYTFDLADTLKRKAMEHGATPQDAEMMAAQVAQLFGEDPLMGSFFRMEPAQKRGEPLVFYKEGGKLKVARFMSGEEGHALYETLTHMPEPITDLWHDLIRGAAIIKRAGIVSNPTFAIANYIRDQVTVGLLRGDYVPFISGIKGLVSEHQQGQAAKLYSYAGGVAGGAVTGPIEKAAEAELQALARKGYWVNRLTSFKGLMELSSVTEAGTRNSVFDTVFKAKKAQGLSDYEAMIEAAYQAQDVLDFSRHGSRTLAIRNILPFINAHVQGLDKAWRTIVDPIARKIAGTQALAGETAEFRNAMASLLKVGGLSAVLGAAWAALNWEKEAYRDASPYFKGTHFIVPMGNKLVVVPKPFELATMFTAGEYAFARYMDDDPRAARQWMDATWQALAPPNVFTDIPLVSTTTELYLGKSLFTGNDIVPGGLQGLPPAQQYNDRTSSLAKAIGRTIGVSPMKVDYAIGSEFGTWGRDIMALSQGVDEDSPTANWEDRVFLRRFIKDPTRTSDVTTRFWQYMGHTTGQYNQDVSGYDNLVRMGAGHEGEAKAFLDGLPARERAYVILKSAGNDFGKAAFGADEQRLHPLNRAYDAVQVLNHIRRDLTDNNLSSWQDATPLKLDPDTRRDLIEDIRELAQMEMRNAFVVMREPGYGNRPLLDVQPVFERISHISPQVADEIATRYATQKVLTTKAVAEAYPQMERALVQDGSEAHVDTLALALIAKAEGWEFEGVRAHKPAKSRMVIPGQAAGAAAAP